MMPRDFLNEDVSGVSNDKISPRDFLNEDQPRETLAASSVMAPFRIGADVLKGGYNVLKNIPNYYESLTTSGPEAINTLIQNPKQALKQGTAGLAEAGQNIFNTPHDIVNYLSNRLNLVPEDINKKVQMGRMPDSEQQINQTFGQPKNSGEEFIRGVGRNAINAVGAFGAAKALNPLQITNKGIAKRVVNELDNQVDKHSTMYNKLWDQAQKQGFNQVPFDQNSLNQDLNILKKSYTPKQYESINKLLNNPTLENAQKAQSDLGVLRRAIEEKAKTTPLLGGENDIHQALSRAENNVESNMFKNSSGQLNNGLANKYKKITNSYRENVVPYRYNSDIQDYLSKDITSKQLIQRLNQGPFAARKGGFLTHPQFAIRNAILPILGTAGTLGGLGYLYNQAFGTPTDHR